MTVKLGVLLTVLLRVCCTFAKTWKRGRVELADLLEELCRITIVR